MPVWVELRSGEVRCYNNAVTWVREYPWTRLKPNGYKNNDSLTCAEIRSDDILSIEFARPCELTWIPSVVDRSIQILLRKAKSINDPNTKQKLAELSKLLRRFNPQRLEWY